jgi:thermostable 8-oxoguanine DNA glycosylase
MTFTKAQKWFGTLIGLSGVLSLIGTYQYLPKQVNEVKDELKEVKKEVRQDHDTIVEIRTKVNNIEKALERNSIIDNNRERYYDAKQGYVYGINYKHTTANSNRVWQRKNASEEPN